MGYKIKDEEELLSLCRESVHILNNLRYTTEEWNEHFGHARRERKNYWEKRADDFLEKIDARCSRKAKTVDIKIEITTKG